MKRKYRCHKCRSSDLVSGYIDDNNQLHAIEYHQNKQQWEFMVEDSEFNKIPKLIPNSTNIQCRNCGHSFSNPY